jgi:hypothetical protein
MDRAKSSVEYPSRSPDLTTLDFYVCDGLKNTVCIGKPRTLQDLRHKIEIVSVAISPATLQEYATPLHVIINNALGWWWIF